jgi:hypothetical protein
MPTLKWFNKYSIDYLVFGRGFFCGKMAVACHPPRIPVSPSPITAPLRSVLVELLKDNGIAYKSSRHAMAMP